MTAPFSEQPFCRQCGKPLAKHTRFMEVKPGPTQYDHPSDWWGYAYESDHGPIKTKADAQKVTNWKVVSVRYRNDGSLWGFGVWDGESYKDDLFCTDRCAVKFARSAAMHVETPAWRKAFDAQQKKGTTR